MGNLAAAFRGRRRSLAVARQIHCVNPWIGRWVTSAHMALCDNKRQLARTAVLAPRYVMEMAEDKWSG